LKLVGFGAPTPLVIENKLKREKLSINPISGWLKQGMIRG